MKLVHRVYLSTMLWAFVALFVGVIKLNKGLARIGCIVAFLAWAGFIVLK